MNTFFYFIRHGEVYNPKKILYGRLPNFSLSQNGKGKIEDAANYFKNKKIDVLYASPLLRARQTAGILGNTLGRKVRFSRLLIEVKLIFEGISLERYKKEIQPLLYTGKYIKKGQESIEEIRKRMMKFIAITAKKFPGKTILVVSHGDPITILKAESCKQEFTWEYKNANYLQAGEWIKFAYDGKKLFLAER